jgi:uncharacterized SAM-dependent methyltransferase
MSTLVQVAIHASQFPESVAGDLRESLRSRQVNHKFHYDSPRQTAQWLALHAAYSPSRTDADCARAYDLSFQAAAARLRARCVHVVGLGCGGGHKDTRLLELLRNSGQAVFYTPSDVSTAMVLVARQRALAVIPAANCFPLVCDLASAGDLPAVMEEHAVAGAARLFTCFGLLPNFEPPVLLPRLASLVRPGDWLLLSANLAPGPDYAAGVRRILPLYDNAPTRDWLMTFLLDLGVQPGDGSLRFGVEEDPAGGGLKRVAARFHFARPREVRVDPDQFEFRAGDSIRLFFSYRHTPARVRALLAPHGLQVLDQWITRSADEGVFLVSRDKDANGERRAANARDKDANGERRTANGERRSQQAHRFQHGPDARHFVGAEQVGFAQGGQHGKEGLGAADLLAEKLEGVREGVAEGKPQRAQAEGVQENRHLVAHPHGAVLQVAVVETQARVQEELLHPVAPGQLNLAGKVIVHQRHRVRAQIEVAHLADVFPLHIAEDGRRIVLGDHAEELLAALGPGEIQNVRPGVETGARDRRLIALHGNRDAGPVQGRQHRQQLALLLRRVHPPGVRQG